MAACRGDWSERGRGVERVVEWPPASPPCIADEMQAYLIGAVKGFVDFFQAARGARVRAG
jgi:hypothetical protein